MKVVIHPADEGGCGHYRLIWPGHAARDQGHDVTVAFDYKYRALWQPNGLGPDRIVGLAKPPNADVVVLQRPLDRTKVELIGALQAHGCAVVVEVDDDFHSIHPRNPAWKGSNPLHDPDRNRDCLMRACERADLVTVSTPALAARYGAHGRVRVLPNCIPARYLTTRPGAYTTEHLDWPDGLMVGWTGSVATHPGDLEQTRGGVAAALRETGAWFGVVGTGVRVARALGLPADPHATGWLPLDAYPEAITRFDVGIVPLLASDFNEAKSWLKGLEMAALGVPFVASPTGEYRALSERGAGVLAATPDEWHDQVARLLTDPIWREECAEQGYDAAAELTVEGNVDAWMDAWTAAYEHRSGSRAA